MAALEAGCRRVEQSWLLVCLCKLRCPVQRLSTAFRMRVEHLHERDKQLLFLESVCDLYIAKYLRAWGVPRQVCVVEPFVSVTATHNLLARTSQPSKHTVLFLLTTFHHCNLNSMLHNSGLW